jgi:hypothetical protein
VIWILLGVEVVVAMLLGVCILGVRVNTRKAQAMVDYAQSKGVHYTDLETFNLEQRSEALERLVLWLAQAFRVVSYRTCTIPAHMDAGVCECEGVGEETVTWNTPIFPKADWWGNAMPEARLMESLFHSVVGPSTDGRFGKEGKS